EKIFQAGRITRGDEGEDAAGAVGKVLAKEFLLDGVEAALGAGDHDDGGVLGDAAGEGEVERLDGEVAGLEFGLECGKAAFGTDIVEGHLAVAGEEVDLFLGGAGDVEDGGGEGVLAA